MELFSKRNIGYASRNFARPLLREGERGERELVGEKCRTRLQEAIIFITSSDANICSHFLVDDKRRKKVYLEPDVLKRFSLSELGYSMLEHFSPKTVEFIGKNDEVLFDIIEMLIVFAKDDDAREKIVSRFKGILNEEKVKFDLFNFRIVDTSHSGFSTVIPLLKDSLIREKLERAMIEGRTSEGQVSTAKVYAEVTQFVFSGTISTKTKKTSEKLCKDLATKWTAQQHVSELANLLSELVKLTKAFNNRVTDIRHTDKHTIPIRRPDLVKFITSLNNQLIELFLTSMPEIFFEVVDANHLQKKYAEDYRINLSNGWVIEAPDEDHDEIRLEDIPF